MLFRSKLTLATIGAVRFVCQVAEFGKTGNRRGESRRRDAEVIGEGAWTQSGVAIEMDQDLCVLRRNAPLRGYCAHVIRMAGDVYLRVQSLHFEHIIVVHREMIIGRWNSSSNRTNS